MTFVRFKKDVAHAIKEISPYFFLNICSMFLHVILCDVMRLTETNFYYYLFK